MAVWIAAAVAALIVAVLLFVPVRLDFRYKKDAVQNTAELYLKYMWFRIKIIPREQKPPKKQAQKKQEPEQKKDFSIEVFKQQFAHYKKIFEHSKDDIAAIFQYAGEKAVVLELVDFKLDYGFEDPAYTGMLMGGICGIAYNILALVDRHLDLREKHVDIRPDFHNNCFQMSFQCIARLKNVHIMVILYKVIKIYFKIKNL